MPCHVPSATVRRGRSATSRQRVPTVVATLNLMAPQERAAHDLLRRFCSGRWPLWRLLGLRRDERTLYAAVEWVRGERPLRFSVAELSLERTAVCWRCFPSALAARRALAALNLEAHAPSPAAADRTAS